MKKNKTLTTTITITLALIAGIWLGKLLFSQPSAKKNQIEHQSTDSPSHKTQWTCSMHPEIRQKEPGRCPLCGMDLIPIEDNPQPTDSSTIHMSPEAMRLAEIQVTPVQIGPIENTLQLFGRVQTDERRVYTQSSHIPGRIEQLIVNYTGEYVSKGQVIAYLYSPELMTAQEELLEAKKMANTQPSMWQAAREKLKNWKLTDQQIDELLNQPNTSYFPILANVSGYVTQKMVNPGDHINTGQPIYQIANLDKVWILFDIHETDIPRVKKGDLISYTVSGLLNTPSQGTISYIDPIIDPVTHVAQARLETTNPALQLKPEMFATGFLTSTPSHKKLMPLVPKTAVMWTGQRSIVYVKTPSKTGITFQAREVSLGTSSNDFFAIETGLKQGEEVATQGTFSLDAAAQLAGKPSMMQ